MDGASHFSTQEVLDWFCATKPVPKKNVAPPKMPCPPAARSINKPIQPPKSRVREPYVPSDLADDLDDLSIDQSSYPTSYHQQVLNFERDYASPDSGEEEGETFRPKPLSSGDTANGPTLTSVFDNYSFDHDSNPDLPISSYRDHIVETIESGQVTVIQGSTGSGKSTQVPQYILEHYAREKRHCNIICTQPRRIAAMSIAKFVAKSRGWRLGSLVGYQIAMDRFISEDTRLNFVTTGVLLQKLINMKNMNQYTHVILDEVITRCSHSVCCDYFTTCRFTIEIWTLIFVFLLSRNYFVPTPSTSK